MRTCCWPQDTKKWDTRKKPWRRRRKHSVSVPTRPNSNRLSIAWPISNDETNKDCLYSWAVVRYRGDDRAADRSRNECRAAELFSRHAGISTRPHQEGQAGSEGYEQTGRDPAGSSGAEDSCRHDREWSGAVATGPGIHSDVG